VTDEPMTQETVNQAFQEIKKVWDEKVAESGKSAQMFVITDNTGFASEFIATYQRAKEHVEWNGLVMPELMPGLEVKILEDE